jgi:hypothetical protein
MQSGSFSEVDDRNPPGTTKASNRRADLATAWSWEAAPRQ